ncbi:hypothetical protein os4_36700 (plasmid) [Comamonadaceae bacterium OS-4]|nr:hypothetical protein os4_36700 [Comamonadaceae bacterium OS-4]
MEDPEITITTAGGTAYTLRPVPMKRLASQSSTDWLKFVQDYVPGAVMAQDYAVKLRSFLQVHKTDALTDGTHSYTLHLNGLVFCNPEVINDEAYTDTFGNADIKHPFANYKLSDAVLLARHTAHLRNCKPLHSLVDAREVIQTAASSAGHLWITGNCALDVLDAAIDGKDLQIRNRLIG